jgi:glycosyltransferase involved in cell wall biosynthesis
VVESLHADIPEVVLHGKSGFLAPVRDFIKLAEYLTFLIDNPEKRVEFGLFGRRRIEEEYNITIQIQKLERLYQKVINKESFE